MQSGLEEICNLLSSSLFFHISKNYRNEWPLKKNLERPFVCLTLEMGGLSVCPQRLLGSTMLPSDYSLLTFIPILRVVLVFRNRLSPWGIWLRRRLF